jgi:hypothetical protein
VSYYVSDPDDSDLRGELPAGLCEVPGCSDYGSHRFRLASLFVCGRHCRMLYADVNGEGYGEVCCVDLARRLSLAGAV